MHPPVSHAPQLVDRSRPLLTRAYEAWCQHHATCTKCIVQDWMAPGAPTIVEPRKRQPWHATVQVAGQDVAYENTPDVSVLCREGGSIFLRWVRAAVDSKPVRELVLED